MFREEEDDRFTYSGHLVFNEILRLKGGLEEFIGELPRFDEDNDIGVNIRGLDSFPEFHEIPLTSDDAQYHWLEISEEEFEDQIAYLDGEERQVTIRNIETTEVWIINEDYLAIRGNQQKVDWAHRLLSRWTSESVLQPVRFESDFLLWLFYQHFTDGDIPGELSIRKLTDAEVKGEIDSYAKATRASGSEDITENATVLMGALQNSEPITMLGGSFSLTPSTIAADLASKGRVHIKASKGTVREASDIERIILSIQFLQAILDLYGYWKDLSPARKYPPTEFFHKMAEILEMQGVNFTHSIEPIIEEYSQKREGGDSGGSVEG